MTIPDSTTPDSTTTSDTEIQLPTEGSENNAGIITSIIGGTRDRGQRATEETALSVGEPVEEPKRELSPEDTETTLTTLKKQFEKNMYWRAGVEWQKVETTLRKNPTALWSVKQMQEQGHDPDVYSLDDEGFDIGTCSEETPTSSRNCVYDAQTAEWMRTNYPDEIFNGSATEMATAMGITLMSFKQLQTSFKVTEENFFRKKKDNSWLLTSEESRTIRPSLGGKCGFALFGILEGNAVKEYLTQTTHHSNLMGWRGQLRVLWN